MRTAAQCVGRVLRGKTDWGLMILADRVSVAKEALLSYVSLTHTFVFSSISWQRFARADKRSKLPKWINQYITETASNLSTDMALVLSKLFMRQISQNANEDETGISLWTLEDVLKAQLKGKEMEHDGPSMGVRMEMEVEEEEEEFEGDDEMLAQAELEL
jgi:DNA excision repair protein ERCC-2